jgi:peptide methionine sulfoxide reductase MsrA
VQLKYNPADVTFSTLVDFFYRVHGKLVLTRSDDQEQPRSGSWDSISLCHFPSQRFAGYSDLLQKHLAEEGTKAAQTHYGSKIQTTIEPLSNYVPGEGYHQDYLNVNPYAGLIQAWLRVCYAL